MTAIRFGDLAAPVPVPGHLHSWQPVAMENHSARVREGALFLAYPGAGSDGRSYLKDAARRGARAALIEPGRHLDGGDLPMVEYPALKESLPSLSGRFYDWPDRSIALAAVTGTAGKTTSSWLTAQLLDRVGRKCGYLGTLGFGFATENALETLENTTPDILRTRSVLHRMAESSADAAVLEASSQGLEQRRLDSLSVEVAAFTNLGSDHLEAHGSREALARAKRSLFELSTLRTLVINADDAFGARLAEELRLHRSDLEIWTYGRSSDATMVISGEGDRASLKVKGHSLPLTAVFGGYNLYNLSCALGMAMALGANPDDLTQAVATSLLLPPGRLQRVLDGPDCYIDYAHSPEALETVLSALKEICGGRLWCVFGCGGERDRSKRSAMGAIASRLADCVIVTQDNPRHENPEAIADQILAGVEGGVRVEVELDRRAAIHRALDGTDSADVVLIAGKGHEQTQQVGDRLLPFDDTAVVKAWKRQRA